MSPEEEYKGPEATPKRRLSLPWTAYGRRKSDTVHAELVAGTQALGHEIGAAREVCESAEGWRIITKTLWVQFDRTRRLYDCIVMQMVKIESHGQWLFSSTALFMVLVLNCEN